MDAFRAANELATIDACCTRALDHLGEPPAEPKDGNRREHLHYRAHAALKVAQDRADQARIAVAQLEEMGMV
jgi:hypothetical protein